MSAWIFDDSGGPYQKKQYANFLKLTKDPVLSGKASKMLGLFDYLKTHKYENPEQLRNSVFFDKAKKKRIFSKTDAERVFIFFSPKGGDGALDHAIRRVGNTALSFTPEALKDPIEFATPFIFFLKTAKDNFPPLDFAIDVASAVNKNIAKTLQSSIPFMVSLTGLPWGDLVGTVIGYVLSSFFIFLNVAMSLSSANFGEAWIGSLAMIPIVGLTLQNWAESGDKLTEKFAEKREKTIDKLEDSSMFQWLGHLIKNYTWDPNSEGLPDAPPPPEPEPAPELEAKPEPEPAPEAAPEAKPEPPPEKTKEQLQTELARLEKLNKYNSSGQDFNEIQEFNDRRDRIKELEDKIKAMGGKRLSTRKNKNGKWRTRRRRFAKR